MQRLNLESPGIQDLVADNTITVDPANPSVSYTPTGATYNAETGDLVLTIASHGFTGSATTTATNTNERTFLLDWTIEQTGFITLLTWDIT